MSIAYMKALGKLVAATGLFGRRVAPNILKNQIYEAMKTEGTSYLVRHVQESEASKVAAYQIATFTAEQKSQLNLESPALGS